jgi:hypothetical protein
LITRSAILLAGTVAVLVLACSGTLSSPTTPVRQTTGTGPNTIRGLVLVYEPDSNWIVAEACAPVGPFKDIANGTDVVVRDGSGKVIGGATLPDGTGEEDDATDHAGSTTHICEFEFAVPGLVTTGSYAVQVGNKPEQKMSLDNLQARFWQLFFEFPGPAPR